MTTIFCTECGTPAVGYPLAEILVKNTEINPPRLAWHPILYNMPRCMEHRIRDANLFLDLPEMRDDIRQRCELANVEVSERWRLRLIWLKVEAAQRLLGKSDTEFKPQDPVA
jgi:hypothetical protein